MSERETYTTVVYSTGHITNDDDDKLREFVHSKDTTKPVPLVTHTEYGWRIYVGGSHGGATESPQEIHDEFTDNGLYRLSGACYALCVEARRAGHRWIEFDCDGPVYDDLPTFDW